MSPLGAVAGDSWGLVSIPLIEAHPWTAPLLASVFITVALTLMNPTTRGRLVLASIRDALAAVYHHRSILQRADTTSCLSNDRSLPLGHDVRY